MKKNQKMTMTEITEEQIIKQNDILIQINYTFLK